MEAPVTEIPHREQTLVGVRFMPVGKIYHFDATRFPDLRKSDWVIVTTSRGRQMGEVATFDPPKHGDADGPFKAIDRIATNRDLAVRHYWTQKETEAMVIGREKVKELGLPVKIVKAEYAFDGSRLAFLYTAEEERPELGTLQQDLQRSFKAKVALLLGVPHRVQPDLDQDGEGAGHLAQPAGNHRHVRPAALLPDLRVRAIRGCAQNAAQARQRGRHAARRRQSRRSLAVERVGARADRRGDLRGAPRRHPAAGRAGGVSEEGGLAVRRRQGLHVRPREEEAQESIVRLGRWRRRRR